MNFVCKHCEKEINEVIVVIDHNFLHKSCENDYKRAKIVNKWKESQILDDIKDNVDKNIIKLFESDTIQIIK